MDQLGVPGALLLQAQHVVSPSSLPADFGSADTNTDTTAFALRGDHHSCTADRQRWGEDQQTLCECEFRAGALRPLALGPHAVKAPKAECGGSTMPAGPAVISL